jgi:hypothetical protein
MNPFAELFAIIRRWRLRRIARRRLREIVRRDHPGYKGVHENAGALAPPRDRVLHHHREAGDVRRAGGLLLRLR